MGEDVTMPGKDDPRGWAPAVSGAQGNAPHAVPAHPRVAQLFELRLSEYTTYPLALLTDGTIARVRVYRDYSAGVEKLTLFLEPITVEVR